MSKTAHPRTSAPKHHCHAIGCDKAVPPRMFMCGSHWKRLPAQHKAAVWKHYRPGQENDKEPSLAYLIASHSAILAMAKIEKRSDDELTRVRHTLNWLEGKNLPLAKMQQHIFDEHSDHAE